MKKESIWESKAKISRADKALIAELKKVPTTIASDVMDRGQAMAAAIKPLAPGVHFAGSAFTIDCLPGNNLITHQALYLAEAGDVLVIDAKAYMDRSVWGGVQNLVATKRSFMAIVIDGVIRDSQEIRGSGLPVFCRGAIPAGPFKEIGGNLNVPISCGGVPVKPGDIIIGDDDGVVVVPQEQAAKVLKRAKEKIALEKEWIRKLSEGKTTLEVVGLEAKVQELGQQLEGKDNGQ